jgi:alkylation response protein AidB-like acyl-CoA dehydrogenase
MSYFLTEEHELIRATAKEFADTEVAPVTRELDENHEFPYELIKRCAELGFLGISIPEEYGGAGADCVSEMIVMEEIARHNSSLASIIDAHTSLGCMPLLFAGTEEQKQKYLVPLAGGEKLCCFALTEPQAGSDSGATQTYAVLDGNEWVINGSKCWITNLGHAEIYFVAVKTDREAKGSRGISILIVEKGTPGFEIGKPEAKMSNNSSHSGQLFFKDCRVPKENLLGEINRGFPLFMQGVDEGRLAISAVAVGMAQGALERSIAYAKQRVQFGKPIAQYQAIAFYLAEMATKVELGRTMLYKTAFMRDAGLPYSKEAAMLKLFTSEMANWVIDKAVQIHGGNGLSVEYEIERFYRDARLLTIGEGTSEICKLVISGHILK